MELNKKRGFFTLLAIILIYSVYTFNKIPTKNLKIHDELYSIAKEYPTKYTVDTFKTDDSVFIFSGIKSKRYSFVYEMNAQEYDSIFYFGEYPDLGMVKYHRPDLYNSYGKYFSAIFYNLNSYGVFLDKHFYDVYALYKNGNVTFCKTRFQLNHISIDPYFTMFRNKQKFNVNGVNYFNNNKLSCSLHFYPVDSLFRKVEKITTEPAEAE